MLNEKDETVKPEETPKPTPEPTQKPTPTPSPGPKEEPEVYYPEETPAEIILPSNPVDTGDHAGLYLWGSVIGITLAGFVALKCKKKS